MSASSSNGEATPPRRRPATATTEDLRIRHASRRRRNRATRPEYGSLYGIMCENNGSSLFVLPILWTDLHCRLLNVKFTPNDPSKDSITTTNARGAVVPRHDKQQMVDTLTSEISTLLSPGDQRPFCKSRAIKRILTTLYPSTMSRPKSVVELDLHFGGRLFRSAVRLPIIWKYGDNAETASFDSAVTRPISSFGISPTEPTTPSSYNSQATVGGPMIAYINRSHLFMIRQNLFRIVPGPSDGDTGNTPVTRLQYLRSKQLLPACSDHDAYLLGIFLAMAQSHFYDVPLSRMSSQGYSWNNYRSQNQSQVDIPEFRDVELRILTHDDDTREFIVYSTTITAEFLQRFAEPTKAPSPPDAGVTIAYTRLPAFPIAGLKERLGKALGKDIAGDLEEQIADAVSSQDTVPNNSQRDKEAERAAGEIPPAPQVGSLKRKRKPFTDIFAVSFDEKTSGDLPGGSHSPTLSPRGKRRRARSVSSSLAVF